MRGVQSFFPHTVNVWRELRTTTSPLWRNLRTNRHNSVLEKRLDTPETLPQDLLLVKNRQDVTKPRRAGLLRPLLRRCRR